MISAVTHRFFRISLWGLLVLLFWTGVDHSSAYAQGLTQSDDLAAAPTDWEQTPALDILPSPPQLPRSQTSEPPVAELDPSQVITGTILVNRSSSSIRFFFDGLIYELPAFRSVGVLPQQALVPLVLYSCGSDSATTGQACSWDAYLLRKDGFYEISASTALTETSAIFLQDAALPPVGQAWIQNRTGHAERILFQDVLFELENTQVLELDLTLSGQSEVAADGESNPNLVYLRRCLGLRLDSVCEWLPVPIFENVYYGLFDTTRVGSVPDSASITVGLQPVLGIERSAIASLPTPAPPLVAAVTATPAAVQGSSATPSIACQIQTPVLNVRSGPGLNFAVIGQISLSDANRGRVTVSGSGLADAWLSVNDAALVGGWIVNDPNLLRCQGTIASASVTTGDANADVAPTPEPVPTPAPATQSTATVACQIQVPTLNIRSGPGIEYLIVGQINRTDADLGRLRAVGRDRDTGWLAVGDPYPSGGWITNQAGYLACETPAAALPIARVTDGRLAPSVPTPAPQIAVAAQETPTPAAVENAVAAATPTGESQTILTVINVFEYDIRFTLDAGQHGLPGGTPSEHDLSPGESWQIAIRPGSIRFSASSSFRSSSGNAEVTIAPGQALTLQLHFSPSPASEQWDLRY